MFDTVRLTENTKRHLTSIKRATGIDQWNILCRWSLCLSLRQEQPISNEVDGELSNVEMTWRTFAGQHDQLYSALVLMAHHREDSNILVGQFLRLHIQRGASTLASSSKSGGLKAILQQPEVLATKAA